MSDELRQLQEWLRAVITDPGVDVAPDAVVRSSSRLSAAQRLDLYRRSYRLRLLEAMRAFHPGLRQMLGHELFDEFALDYIRARPSRSYRLQRLGEGFADHLAATRPDLDGDPEAWPSVMIDLARLERTFAEVYEAWGTEHEVLPAAGDLPAEPDPGWLAATVTPASCLRLVRSSFPAGPYLSAVRRGEDPPLPATAGLDRHRTIGVRRRFGCSERKKAWSAQPRMRRHASADSTPAKCAAASMWAPRTKRSRSS